MIVSPTRELALQIFEVLRKVGGHHQLSAGLITGYAYVIGSAIICIITTNTYALIQFHANRSLILGDCNVPD
jgi:hypothetical protein